MSLQSLQWCRKEEWFFGIPGRWLLATSSHTTDLFIRWVLGALRYNIRLARHLVIYLPTSSR